MTSSTRTDPPPELEWGKTKLDGVTKWRSGWLVIVNHPSTTGYVLWHKGRRIWAFKELPSAKTCAAWLERG